jgi:O-antigen ligase
MSKLAERGPLLFFVLAVGLDAYIRGNRTGLRRPLFVAAALGVVALGLYISTELAPTRATDAGKYGLESNADRMDLFAAGLSAFTERPLWGWGGSLVGRIVNGEEWWYVHSAYLDPLIDTGVTGALLFGAMLTLLTICVRRSWVHLGGAGGVAVSVIPLFVLVALEAQVSGTVWSTRHLWFLTGVLAVLDPSSRHGFVSIARNQATGAVWRGPGTRRVPAPWQSLDPSGKGH